MSANNGWFQSDRVPSFAQMLKKNLPAQPPAPTVTPPAATSLDCDGLARLASKVTPVTGTASFRGGGFRGLWAGSGWPCGSFRSVSATNGSGGAERSLTSPEAALLHCRVTLYTLYNYIV